MTLILSFYTKNLFFSVPGLSLAPKAASRTYFTLMPLLQAWVRSQNRYKKLIRYDSISIRYNMKMTILKKVPI